ncbi:deoxyribodipyrimidine photo-lyase [Desulfocurvus sp. DL9XJH121]
MKVHPGRVHALRPLTGELSAGPVVCWLSRDQRARDNWALLHARDLAESERPLVAAFCLAPGFLGATLRQYDFLLRGLRETAARLARRGIPLALLTGDPVREIPTLCSALAASVLVTDFDPLRVKRGWLRGVCEAVRLPVHEVDAHNVVPVRAASDKQEYAARTIRPKIHRLLPEFLEDFPELEPPAVPAPALAEPDWDAARADLRVDESVAPVPTPPGEDAARARLDGFLNGISGYAVRRNDPNAEAVSGLSPYLHFGHLAPQRAALEAGRTGRGEDAAAFLEELVVRRELSDNYCFYNPYYDSLDGAPAWAVKTLDAHRDDPRPHLYTYARFEAARTHSALWNAAQGQLLATGTMHGYMRMYWAKKILEWSPSPEDALATAIALNDRYQLDGRDPNGYVGALWSVAGLHDRPWKERPVLGTVRYMNERGCRRKFDVDAYAARFALPV